ncbi:MAG: mannan endo,4-beta-mannosidase [Micromonosporaceae bacterium]|nr:mannan endo,4-beta-mannosidase [Micromonosporaceae bacterium]
MQLNDHVWHRSCALALTLVAQLTIVAGTAPPLTSAAAHATAVAHTSTTTSAEAAARAGAPRAAAPGFVQRSGTRLVLDGQPYVFTGLNIYNAATASGWCWYPMVPNNVLGDSLTSIGSGKEAFRAWFFQFEATIDGHRDWSRFDQTLATARAHGQRVIAVLVDQWGNCEGWPSVAAGYKNEAWYRDGYRTQPTGPGLPATYREWVSEMVTRYRDDPTILAWQLVNEAEDATTLGGACPATAAQSLVGFATDMAALVKSIDSNHLLSLGTIGAGQCGTNASEYATVHAVSGIDVCEYHDYGNPTTPVPGDRANGLTARLRQCRALGKPLFTGELGLRAGDADGTLAGRARLLDAKLRGQFDAGVVGVLVWAWRNRENGGSATDDYYVGPGDPALTVLGTH